ncbi:unnamed protein product, partial [Ectocarpus sp. 6 AP-2014]
MTRQHPTSSLTLTPQFPPICSSALGLAGLAAQWPPVHTRALRPARKK